MSDPVSALKGRSFEGLVQVTETGVQGLIALRGDFSAKAVKDAVRDLTGLDIPAQRMVLGEGDRTVAWMSPDELLILCPYAEAPQDVETLTRALAGQHALVANVSDAQACFALQDTGPNGTALREVIAKLAPVDMSPDALPVGEIRRTRLAQAHAAFWLTDAAQARLLCPRSVAPYVMDLLCTAAQPGSEVGVFG